MHINVWEIYPELLFETLSSAGTDISWGPGIYTGLACGCDNVSCDCSFGTDLSSSWTTPTSLCLVFLSLFSLPTNLVFELKAWNCLKSIGKLPPSSFITCSIKEHCTQDV